MSSLTIVALGTGLVFCVLAGFLLLYRPAWRLNLSPPPEPELSPVEAARLLALVPQGASVRVEAVDEAGAMAFARSVLALLAAEGRHIEDQAVFTVRGILGTGYLHFNDERRHGILVMQRPERGCAALALD